MAFRRLVHRFIVTVKGNSGGFKKTYQAILAPSIEEAGMSRSQNISKTASPVEIKRVLKLKLLLITTCLYSVGESKYGKEFGTYVSCRAEPIDVSNVGRAPKIRPRTSVNRQNIRSSLLSTHYLSSPGMSYNSRAPATVAHDNVLYPATQRI